MDREVRAGNSLLVYFCCVARGVADLPVLMSTTKLKINPLKKRSISRTHLRPARELRENIVKFTCASGDVEEKINQKPRPIVAIAAHYNFRDGHRDSNVFLKTCNPKKRTEFFLDETTAAALQYSPPWSNKIAPQLLR